MRVLKIVLSDFTRESRDVRELKVLSEMGAHVSVLCDVSLESNSDAIINDIVVKRVPLVRRDLSLPLMLLCLIPGLYQWVKQIKVMKPDILTCHDLIPLAIGYLAKVLNPDLKNVKLVYDSHELEMDRSINERRRPWMRRPLMTLERYLITKSAGMIVVSESISAVIREEYRPVITPAVVRNVPNYWDVEAQACLINRRVMCEKMTWALTDCIVMYHGALAAERGIETAIKAISGIPYCRMVIMGNGSLKPQLQMLVQDLSIEESVLFIDSVPQEDIWKYVGAADIGLCILQNSNRNHYYALPNKLFECIQSEVPVIGSNFPEIQRIIDGYGVGLCCDPSDAGEMQGCIIRLKEDSQLLNKIQGNIQRAKPELCWEKECIKLKQMYQPILKDFIP